ncbi:MAG: RNase adapter RapZ [Lachnospirales bacterium]
MNLCIVTGMSGAGKSAALNFFEDFGYYCVDNLPPQLIKNFIDICDDNNEIENVAIGIDIRGGKLFNDLISALDELTSIEIKYKIIFLECSDNALVKRFKETRRNHPLSKTKSISECIANEREILKTIRDLAKETGYIVDTTKLLNRDLKSTLTKILDNEAKAYDNIVISINSFGFKFGIPTDSDLVFDVRFIPNPFYIASLKEKTGNDQEVFDYVMSFNESQEFLKKLEDMVEFLIPKYIKEGKNLLVVNIGCTGGKHRSVTIARGLYDYLNTLDENYNIVLKHINIEHKK